MEVPFDSIGTAIGPSITRPDWDDAVPGLGYSSNHPPDRQQRVTWLTLRTFLEIAVAGVIIQ